MQVPLSTFAGLGALHAEATLLIHTHVREDQFSLYGFVTAREKQLFELLLSASGVGPSLALKILSGMNLEELVPAIRKGDLAQLVRIPGVGRKTAERIVVELRDKLAAVDVAEAGKPATRSQLESDVASALMNLGYDARSVDKAIEKARDSSGADFEELAARIPADPGKLRDAKGSAGGTMNEYGTSIYERQPDRRVGSLRGAVTGITAYERRAESNCFRKAYDEDARVDASVRPASFGDYIGQERVKENLQIAVEAARARGDALDHVLLYGPPGLGQDDAGANSRE